MNIKFVTLNIEHGGKLFDKIVDFVKKEDPDIIVFQEVFDSKKEEKEKRFRTFEEFKIAFKNKLPNSAFQSSSFFIIDEFPEGAEFGNATFTKFKIVKNDKVEINAPYGVVDERGISDFSWEPCIAQHTALEIKGKTLNVYNLHGVWGFDGKDNLRRIEMANVIARAMKGNNPMILAGDTNFTKEAVETIKIIETSGVKSVFEDTLKSTFNMLHKTDPGYSTAAVDMVFASNDLEVIDKKLLDVDVSDHYPLTVTFRM